jgi:hypothetical protein
MIRWAHTPPPRDWVSILSPKLNRSCQVVLAGPVVGVWTHWSSTTGQSMPCQEGGCVLCSTQKPRWKGFAPAYLRSGRKVVVEVTHGCLQQNPGLLDGSLVGWEVRFERRGPRPNASVYLVPLAPISEPEKVVAFDPRPHLLRMWGLG